MQIKPIAFDQAAYEKFDTTIVYEYLGKIKFDKVENHADYQKLTDGEKIIYPLLRLGLEMEVNTDFESFFEREGAWAKEVAESLQKIGATAALNEFLAACKIFFGNAEWKTLEAARQASYRESCLDRLSETERKALFEMSEPFTAMVDPAVFLAFQYYEKAN